MNEYTNLKISDFNKFTEEVFSNYGRILSDYIFLNKFKTSLRKHVNIKGENYLQEIKKNNKYHQSLLCHYHKILVQIIFQIIPIIWKVKNDV